MEFGWKLAALIAEWTEEPEPINFTEESALKAYISNLKLKEN